MRAGFDSERSEVLLALAYEFDVELLSVLVKTWIRFQALRPTTKTTVDKRPATAMPRATTWASGRDEPRSDRAKVAPGAGPRADGRGPCGRRGEPGSHVGAGSVADRVLI